MLFLFLGGRCRSGGENFFAGHFQRCFGNLLLNLFLANHGLTVGFGKSLGEFLNASSSVHQPLLTGEERVARRADIDFDQRHRGASNEFAAASAFDRRGLVFGMNSCLHEGGTIQLIIQCANFFLKPAPGVFPLKNSLILSGKVIGRPHAIAITA